MKIALITGTSSGIGLATALHLARHGYRVFASMREPVSGAAALKEAVQAERLPLEVVQLDVDDAASATRAVAEVLEKAGRIDVLVNNAGIGGGTSIEETPEEHYRALMETNFFGPLRLIRAVLPGMRERRSGAIVNVSSVSGRVAFAPLSSYAASKGALEALSQVLAQEVRRFNIRVAVIEPGVVQSAMSTKARRTPDPSSPYHEFVLRLYRILKKRLNNRTPAERVAETIRHAIETDRPQLHYPVGEDAHQWISGRLRISDDDWLDYGKAMSDAEVVAYQRKHFGMDI